ncbi:Cysteine desulfurase [Syntrophobotulus glycolicus DSM 8271]|uniref:Cysteine desulfurase n=1 Tax=Syntrophobotulus glycolicus (strain DSM 8271 / FlGlyR) TaxID=645991 RepID=F0T0J7_SYNGF|nr:aminotransferase class V-fold PLP-dependent enzyme [Syntrophobotulus glycolicus]ADY55062.1 Cysteine desulfurase [Syntrophobotulus glycolicus DSM 8271]
MRLLMSKASYRNLVIGVDTLVPLHNGQQVTAINFDNAATTPPLVRVMEEINAFAPYYSSIHRGAGYKSALSSEKFEEARQTVLDFVGADSRKDTAIFVKNATEAINKLAFRLCSGSDEQKSRFSPEKKGVVLSTSMEHHSNDLPWRGRFALDYVEIDQWGRLHLSDLENKLQKYAGRVKLVTVSGASNVTGYVNPVHRIAETAHKYGAKIMVDGSQLIPHLPFDMREHGSKRHIDYLVFSAHKMYAPFGTGVLIGPKDTFVPGDPDITGGGTVQVVTHEDVIWNPPPAKEEAGTPNLMGVVALDAAIKTLRGIGMDNIGRHEKDLADYLLKGMKSIPHLDIYVRETGDERLGIIPFNVRGIFHETMAGVMAGEAGIAIRNGCFCAHPYIHRLLKVPNMDIVRMINSPGEQKPGMVRVSFGLYNERREVDVLLSLLEKVSRNRRMYLRKYS